MIKYASECVESYSTDGCMRTGTTSGSHSFCQNCIQGGKSFMFGIQTLGFCLYGWCVICWVGIYASKVTTTNKFILILIYHQSSSLVSSEEVQYQYESFTSRMSIEFCELLSVACRNLVKEEKQKSWNQENDCCPKFGWIFGKTPKWPWSSPWSRLGKLFLSRNSLLFP